MFNFQHYFFLLPVNCIFNLRFAFDMPWAQVNQKIYHGMFFLINMGLWAEARKGGYVNRDDQKNGRCSPIHHAQLHCVQNHISAKHGNKKSQMARPTVERQQSNLNFVVLKSISQLFCKASSLKADFGHKLIFSRVRPNSVKRSIWHKNGELVDSDCLFLASKD